MKFLKYMALSVGTVLALSSCADFLDKEPDERVTITTGEQVLDFLTSGYSIANWGWLAELSSDNVIDNNAPHYPYNPDSKQVLVHYNLSSYDRGDDEIFKFEPGKSNTSTDSPTFVWQGCYGAIATANQALVYIDEIAAKNGGTLTNELKVARAEALLIRAYHHFILVNMFSQAYKNPEASKNDVGIPYITKPETTVKPSYDRGNVADVYDKIQADLEEGLKDISDAYYGNTPKWHFNVNAAHAFAARFYLYKRDYDKVIEHADAVLGSGTANLASMLMRYDGFGDATYSSDYANVWQNPNQNNNLMLISTNSTQWRRSAGSRYACTGDAIKGVIYHTLPNSSWYVIPCGYVSGATFYSGNQDYGFATSKVGERFEYTDKVSGIGYAHVIRREFTATELLLDRIEAKLLSTTHQDINGAVEDLLAYEESRQTFTEDEAATFARGLKPLTKEMIDNWYSKSTNVNCYDNWDFTQRMSSDFVVPANAVTYMNCLNDFRRYETWMEGWRFFDLKRFGIEYSHFVGVDNTEYKLTWNDPRRALEVPQDVLGAGLQTSRPTDNNKTLTESEYKHY